MLFNLFALLIGGVFPRRAEYGLQGLQVFGFVQVGKDGLHVYAVAGGRLAVVV